MYLHCHFKIVKRVEASQTDGDIMQMARRQVDLKAMIDNEQEDHLRQVLKSLSVDGESFSCNFSLTLYWHCV